MTEYAKAKCEGAIEALEWLIHYHKERTRQERRRLGDYKRAKLVADAMHATGFGEHETDVHLVEYMIPHIENQISQDKRVVWSAGYDLREQLRKLDDITERLNA
jgi:hypothetical protein